ncbi:glycerol-3-phosphate dehydrogenase/oxidase [Desulfatiferula olefinivorans]
MDDSWDLVIIGGGITGAGLLREAVRCGLKTLLVEQKDFAWGTSSRSSKLVHGGLRYLKEGDFSLTRESVNERERLLREAPGLVTPLEFLLPIYKGRKPGRWMMEAGLTIYDIIAGAWRHRYFGKEAFRRIEPLVSAAGLRGGFCFTDAQVDDARLVLRLIAEAEAHGALALNYTRAVSIQRSRSRAVRGLVVEDTETGASREIRTPLVINATGAWAEALHPSPEKGRHLRPLRGSHLVFPKSLIPIRSTVSFFNKEDGRALFAIPWEGAVLVGTTDLDHDAPLDREPSISPAEARYILDSLKAVFPSADLSLASAVSSFAGVRPVVSEGKVAADKESREHVIWVDAGLVTVTGGKLTTFRALAWDTLSAARPFLPPGERGGRSEPVFDAVELPACFDHLSREQLDLLVGRHGREAARILSSAESADLDTIPGTRTLWAELVHGARSEKIRHLDDLLLRRVRIGLLLEGGGEKEMTRIRRLCEPVLPWDGARWDREIDDYRALWHACYAPPS